MGSLYSKGETTMTIKEALNTIDKETWRKIKDALNEAFEEDIKEENDKMFTEHVYNIVKAESEGLDSIYGDYIQHLVGIFGFNALLEAKLLESCGVVNGRQLYALVEIK